MLLREQVDRLILFPSFLNSLSEKLEIINKSKTPMVLCGSSKNEMDNISYVKCDNKIGAYTAINHLIDHNCKKISCIFPCVDESQYESRLKGYKKALLDHKIPFNKNLVKICKPTNSSIFNTTEELLKDENPDGIFCLYDYAAIAVIRTILKTGRKIPDDIALIGYDNIHISNFLPITLSTIDTHANDVGRNAANLLINKIKNINSPCKKIILHPDLIVRESSQKIKYD